MTKLRRERFLSDELFTFECKCMIRGILLYSRHRGDLRARPPLDNGDVGGDDERGNDDGAYERSRAEDLPPEVLAGQRHAALRPRGLQLDLAGTGIRFTEPSRLEGAH